MRAYDYQPLQTGEIRLLRLDPVRSPEQQLSGAIIHHVLANPTFHPKEKDVDGHLEHSLPYDAISYHWGADTRTPYQILINDESNGQSVINITASLHTVLRRLVLEDAERVVWADAICINQVVSGSNKEKGEQIQLMPDIYRIAASVQVYLGDDDSHDVAAALDLMASIADYSEYLDESQHMHAGIGTTLAQQRGFVLAPAKDKRWVALRAFLRRPWFRRVWIIQEFVYATEIAVLCGEHKIDWHILWLFSKAYADNRQLIFCGYSPDLIGTRRFDLYREAHEGARAMHTVTDLRMRAWGYMTPFYMILSLNEDRDKDKFSGLSIRKDLDTIKKYEDFARYNLLYDRALGKTFPFGQPDMMDLLYRTTNFLATQPVDRLYALLGLAGDTSYLKPIYSDQQTLNVVTTKFAASFVAQGLLSRVLATAGIRSESPSPNDPPSWVPNWTKMVYSQDILIGFNRFADLAVQANEKARANKEKESGSSNTEATAAGHADGQAPDPEASTKQSGEDGDEPLLYNASLDAPLDYHINESDGTLSLKVTAVDVVRGILPGKLSLGTPMYSSMIQKLGQDYPNGQPMEEALWRTLVGNRTDDGRPAPEEYAAQYENLKRHEFALLSRGTVLIGIVALIAFPFVVLAIRLVPIYAHVAAVSVGIFAKRVPLIPSVIFIALLPVFRWLWIMALVPVLVALGWYVFLKKYPNLFLSALRYAGVTAAVSIGSTPQDCSGYLASFGAMVNRYNLGFTTSFLLGLFPLLAREGDVVVIVHGCHAPFLVRATKRQGYYKLVGECYVHGVMNGECMTAQSQSIEISLC